MLLWFYLILLFTFFLFYFSKSLKMLYICRAEKHFQGESFGMFLVSSFQHPLFPLYSFQTKATSFHFSYFSVQLQSRADFYAYSKKHMVWASSWKIFVWFGVWGCSLRSQWLISCLQTLWSSSRTKILGAKYAPYFGMCWVTSDSWDYHTSGNEDVIFLLWKDLSQYGYEQHVLTFLFFNPVNTCCLILWKLFLSVWKNWERA